MRNPIYVTAVLGSLLLAATHLPAFAQEGQDKIQDSVNDYHYQMPLTMSGKNGVLALDLPRDVFMHAQQARLQDLRIFDKNGKKVPFAFYQPPGVQREARELALKSFPLRGLEPGQVAQNDETRLALQVDTDSRGQLTSLRLKSNRDGKAQGLQGWVFDTGLRGEADTWPQISHLQFGAAEDEGKTLDNYQARVWLAVSNDLQQWETIASADLRWLRNTEGASLQQNRIHFEPRRFRYARLLWDGGKPVSFAAVQAYAEQAVSSAINWHSLRLAPQPGQQDSDLQYAAALGLPVERVSLEFKEANLVLPAQIGTYQELPALKPGQKNRIEFQPWLSTSFYQITQQGKTRKSGPIHIAENHAQTWVLRAELEKGVKLETRPELVLYWRPKRIVFLTSGNGPYTLAFGHPKAKAGAVDVAQVAPNFDSAELTKVELAQAGSMQENPQAAARAQAGQKAADAAAQSAQQRTWMLWGVLLLGVGVLAVLVLRLMKQMKQEGGGDKAA